MWVKVQNVDTPEELKNLNPSPIVVFKIKSVFNKTLVSRTKFDADLPEEYDGSVLNDSSLDQEDKTPERSIKVMTSDTITTV